MRAKVLTRLNQLLDDLQQAQCVQPLSPQYVGAGHVPAICQFYFGGLPQRRLWVRDFNGAGLMALWFLAESYGHLALASGPEVGQLTDRLESLIARGASLPQLFQGDGNDPFGCPPAAMGWFPLVDGWRLPSFVPAFLRNSPLVGTKRQRSNLGDGDAAAWCIGIDHALPGVLRYTYDVHQLELFEPLLATAQARSTFVPLASDLRARVGHGPLGTFYGTSAQKPQHLSCCVMANILAAIVQLGGFEPDSVAASDVAAAVAFVRRATKLALAEQLPWRLFAYDYFIVDAQPMMYILKADRTIRAQGLAAIPELLDEPTLQQARRFVQTRARSYLAHSRLHEQAGAEAYVNLIMCLNSLEQLRHIDPVLDDRHLSDELVHALAIPNPYAPTVCCTGPYRELKLGPLEVYVEMSSPAFTTAPLVEALALNMTRYC